MGENFSNESWDEEWLKNVSIKELQEIIKNFRERIKHNACENDIFDRFMQKIETKVGAAPQALFENDPKPQMTVRRRSKSRCSAVERSSKLSWEQKFQVAQVEYEEMKQDIEKSESVMNNIIDDLNAKITELDLRYEDEKKYRTDFEKSVVKDGYVERTKSVASEKFIRFLEEHLKQKDTILEKLRLNSATLRMQLKKCKEQLRQKEEIGEVLHAIDFEQLKIENSQSLAKIDEKNQEIQKLKAVAARTLHIVNTLKMRLHELHQEKRRLEAEIHQRSEITKRAKNEMLTVEEEIKKEQCSNRRFQAHVESYQVPTIIDFVRLKSEERQVMRQETIYTRKMKIAEMALVKHKKLWAQVRRTCSGGELSAAP